jgi:hypothetical protein
VTVMRHPITDRTVLLSAVLVILIGCGGAQVAVPPILPIPLVERIPLVIGVHLPEALLEYSHEEELEGGSKWRIHLGGAQPAMFDNLLSGMFEGVREVADPEHPGSEVSGVLRPTIQEVQFSTPEQTRSDYFEVWVRYRFELFDRDGTSLGQWPLTAYGKANARNYGLSRREPALQAAAIAAMRDAMAFFTVQFGSVPAVRTWLAGELGGSTP